MGARNPGASRGGWGAVLLVDDAPQTQAALRRALESLGYPVLVRPYTARLPELVAEHAPRLVALGSQRTNASSYDVCRQLRAASAVPIVVLSSCTQPTEIARGLALGADDVIAQPGDPGDVAARIETVLRRVQRHHAGAPPAYRCGPLTVDFARQQVQLDGTPVELSGVEFRLLAYLARHAGRTLVDDALIVAAWGSAYERDIAFLHLCISRLRRKLSEDYSAPRFIRTQPGVGYLLADQATLDAGLRANER